MKPTLTSIFTGFLLLFACYHAAEYMILRLNSSLGFLTLSINFFLLAYFVAKQQGDGDLHGWGLPFKKGFPVLFVAGLTVGLVISSALFITCLVLHIEVISFVPPVHQFLSQAALLVFGCALSSLTEDVLTRGYLYRHVAHRWRKPSIALFSALVYALNHIHRLNEPVYFIYVFILGIQLVVPLLVTGNLWYTFGVHWAGNIVYHLTNNVLHATSGSNGFPGIVVAIVFVLLTIPLHYSISRRLAGCNKKNSFFSLQRHSSAFIRHSSRVI